MTVTRQMRKQARKGKLKVGLKLTSGREPRGVTATLHSTEPLERGELFLGGSRFIFLPREYYLGLPVFVEVEGQFSG